MAAVRIALEASTYATKLRGLEVEYWFGFIFLGTAVVLTLTQAWVSTHPSEIVSADDAKEKLKTAVEKTKEAAQKTKRASGRLTGARQLLEPKDQSVSRLIATMSDEQRALIKLVADQEVDAEAAADDAMEATTEAEEEVTKVQGFLGVADTVASKLPLVGGAILFALLGCAVSGFIDVSFG